MAEVNRNDATTEEFRERMAKLPVVFKHQDYQTFNEAYLGFGCIVSVTDYGRYKALPPWELEQKARGQVRTGYSQYSHFLDDGGNEPIAIAIVLNPNGYSLKSVFKKGGETDVKE